MKRYRIYQVDAFTTEKFKGNPAGVVPDADGLSDGEMQCIARELNNSETAFILSPTDPDHDVWIRFFTPTTEVPSCGHATIAAHYVRAVENQMNSSTLRQRIGIGILPVDVTKEENDYTIQMTQGDIEFYPPLAASDCEQLLVHLGLVQEDLDERCPVQIVSTGHSKVLIGIKSRKRLNSLSPDMNGLSTLSESIGCNGYFVFTLDSKSSDIKSHGRMFAPAIGILEDPVTGNANGPLGAYLVKHRFAEHDGNVLSFKAEQGEAIGRSGIVDVTVKIHNGNPIQVKVGGRAVIVFRTEIEM
ncbi:MAG: PhzF family isomerase [Gemmatimonadota bacterium]|nr:MAG: PhzF family isomerase [Gemmatimonadota bacterium]